MKPPRVVHSIKEGVLIDDPFDMHMAQKQNGNIHLPSHQVAEAKKIIYHIKLHSSIKSDLFSATLDNEAASSSTKCT